MISRRMEHRQDQSTYLWKPKWLAFHVPSSCLHHLLNRGSSFDDLAVLCISIQPLISRATQLTGIGETFSQVKNFVGKPKITLYGVLAGCGLGRPRGFLEEGVRHATALGVIAGRHGVDYARLGVLLVIVDKPRKRISEFM